MALKTTKLGRSGICATKLGMGTWGLGGVYYGKVDPDEGQRVVRSYLDAGGNVLDSAYTYHAAEEITGRAIRGVDRDALVLISKTYAGTEGVEDVPQVRRELDVTLRALNTDYLDFYLMHGSPRATDRMEALLDEFEALRDEGKIRAIGCSIPGPMVTDRSVALARQYIATGRIDLIQLTFSVARQKLGSVFAQARAEGVAVQARWVLESGMLGGRYQPGHEFAWPDTRNRYRPNERDAMLGVARDIAHDLPPGYKSPAQVAVAFVMQHPEVDSVLLGGVKTEQVQRNAALDNLPPLPAEYREALCRLYEPRNDEFNPTGDFEHVPSVREAG